MPDVSLRAAIHADARFLHRVSSEAMAPVEARLGRLREKTADQVEDEVASYFAAIAPEQLQVIERGGVPVGRLRVVRSPEELYIGGIQLLPEAQGAGIGGAVMGGLIAEAAERGIAVRLEVHKVNKGARHFYRRLGFQISGETEEQLELTLRPSRGPR